MDQSSPRSDLFESAHLMQHPNQLRVQPHGLGWSRPKPMPMPIPVPMLMPMPMPQGDRPPLWPIAAFPHGIPVQAPASIPVPLPSNFRPPHQVKEFIPRGLSSESTPSVVAATTNPGNSPDEDEIVVNHFRNLLNKVIPAPNPLPLVIYSDNSGTPSYSYSPNANFPLHLFKVPYFLSGTLPSSAAEGIISSAQPQGKSMPINMYKLRATPTFKQFMSLKKFSTLLKLLDMFCCYDNAFPYHVLRIPLGSSEASHNFIDSLCQPNSFLEHHTVAAYAIYDAIIRGSLESGISSTMHQLKAPDRVLLFLLISLAHFNTPRPSAFWTPENPCHLPIIPSDWTIERPIFLHGSPLSSESLALIKSCPQLSIPATLSLYLTHLNRSTFSLHPMDSLSIHFASLLFPLFIRDKTASRLLFKLLQHELGELSASSWAHLLPPSGPAPKVLRKNKRSNKAPETDDLTRFDPSNFDTKSLHIFSSSALTTLFQKYPHARIPVLQALAQKQNAIVIGRLAYASLIGPNPRHQPHVSFIHVSEPFLKHITASLDFYRSRLPIIAADVAEELHYFSSTFNLSDLLTPFVNRFADSLKRKESHFLAFYENMLPYFDMSPVKHLYDDFVFRFPELNTPESRIQSDPDRYYYQYPANVPIVFVSAETLPLLAVTLSYESLMQNTLVLGGFPLVGVDVETGFSLFDQDVGDLLQISTSSYSFLIDLVHLSHEVKSVLISFFTDPRILKLFYSQNGDVARISFALATSATGHNRHRFNRLVLRTVSQHYPKSRPIQGSVDLIYISKFLNRKLNGGLKKLCLEFLGRPLDKTFQCSSWRQRPLLRGQSVYAALDAWCLVEIARVVFNDENFTQFLSFAASPKDTRRLNLAGDRLASELTNFHIGYPLVSNYEDEADGEDEDVNDLKVDEDATENDCNYSSADDDYVPEQG